MVYRKNYSKKIVDEVYKKTNGRCYHCNKKLIYKYRLPSQSNNYWNIDHYPVKYKDIENQCCIGVTDQLDLNNLVPSCGYCNKSHKYEINNNYCCGLYKSSQFPCKKICLIM